MGAGGKGIGIGVLVLPGGIDGSFGYYRGLAEWCVKDE